VIEYVMKFGKKVDPEILNFIETNWDWNVGYETETTLLNGIILHKLYSK